MEPLDIWRSAQLLVRQYGTFAPQECRDRADAHAARDDADGAAIWEAIRRAAERLLEHGPPTDIPGLRS